VISSTTSLTPTTGVSARTDLVPTLETLSQFGAGFSICMIRYENSVLRDRLYKIKETFMNTIDSNGGELKDGDTVQVVKDLKVRGSSMVLKQGTVVKKIRLTDNPEEVEGKVNGTKMVLKTCFIKKRK
jgi:protein PhnA